MKVEIPLLGYQRPVIDLYGLPSLIDTGAIIPMSSLSPNLLSLIWNAKPVIKDVKIGGIGGQELGDVYSLENFRINDIIFDKLEVFVSKEQSKNKIKHSFLLSATLFYGMSYTFDTRDKNNQTMLIDIPESLSLHRTFEIKQLEGQLYAQIDGVLLQDIQPTTNYIQNNEQNENNLYTNLYDVLSKLSQNKHIIRTDFQKNKRIIYIDKKDIIYVEEKNIKSLSKAIFDLNNILEQDLSNMLLYEKQKETEREEHFYE